MTAADLVGYTFASIGTVLVAISALGLVRLPDAYNRANAVTKGASLGVSSVLLGVFMLEPSLGTAVVLGLSVVLQLLTTPFGAYALGRAAYRAGAPFVASTRRNDLPDQDR